MTVEIVPSEVVYAQIQLSKEADTLCHELGAKLFTEEGNAPIALDCAFNCFAAVRDGLWIQTLDFPKTGGSEVADDDESIQNELDRKLSERSEVLLHHLHFRPSPLILWLISLLGLQEVQCVVSQAVGEEAADFAAGAAEVVEAVLGASTMADFCQNAVRIEDRDYGIVRRAVKLSCGNSLGIACSPRLITVDDLAASFCRLDDSLAEDRHVLNELCSRVAQLGEGRGQEFQEITQRLSAVLGAMVDWANSAVTHDDRLEELAGSDWQQLRKRCKKVLKKYSKLGLFDKVGRKKYRYRSL